MELIWYGTASLILREGERAIAFDPFGGIAPGELKRPPAALPYEEELRGEEAVFVTHGHFDHIYHLPRLCAGREVPIYCTAAPAKTLRREGVDPEQLREIGPGWRGTVGPFDVRAFQGRHCKYDAGLILQTGLKRRFFRHLGHVLRLMRVNAAYPEKGEILFYEVACGGLRLQIMGSMNLDGEVDYPTGADVLILPLQGRSDQDVYALGLVERLAPKAVLLDHYDNSFEPLTQAVETSGFVRGVEERFSIPCRALEKGKRVLLERRQGGEV